MNRSLNLLVALLLASTGLAACGDDTVDYPTPASWTVSYGGQTYCGYQYDEHEIDMYGPVACVRVQYPSVSVITVVGSLGAILLDYLTEYDGFYHSGYWYDQYYSPLGARYQVTVIQRTTYLDNSRAFEDKYAGQIKTNSAKAKWSSGKTGTYSFPASNAKAKNKPATNTPKAATPKAATPKPPAPKPATPKAATPAAPKPAGTRR